MTEHEDFPEEMDDLVLDDPELDSYEVVAYARDARQAETFRDLLFDHDIPALLEEDDEGAYKFVSDGIAILVPDDTAEEARDILGELELIEELDSADPDLDDDEDDADETSDMQPLDADVYLDDSDDDDDAEDPFGADDDDSY